MDRTNLPRTLLLFLACAAWVFLLLCLGSFHYDDWPSHAVEPHPPVQNLCGSVGAFFAYWSFVALGQGIFPVMFFTGATLVLVLAGVRIGDGWMRGVGLAIVAVAFAAAFRHFSPAVRDGFPEGRGGVIGIGVSTFLQHYFSTAGTRLVLVTAALVGLLLAADDLVLRAPRLIAGTLASWKQNGARLALSGMPRLAGAARSGNDGRMTLRLPKREPAHTADDEDDTSRSRLRAGATGLALPHRGDKPVAAAPPKRSLFGKLTGSSAVAASAVVATLNNRDDNDPDDSDVIDLSYPTDDEHLAHAAADAAFMGDDDPAPSAPAVIPPVAQQAVVKKAPVINRTPSPGGSVAPQRPVPVVVSGVKPQAAVNVGADEADDDIDTHDVIPPPSAAIGSGASADGPLMEAPVVRKDIVVKLPNTLKPRQIAAPPVVPKELGEYALPAWEHLADAEQGYTESQEAFVREQAAQLEQALKEFEIDAHVVEIDTGPVITMYELSLAPGIKVSTISGLSNDIQRSLRAETVRIVAPIPGKNTVGIEVPNEQKEKVRFKDLMQLAAPETLARMDIPLFLGKDASGEPLITDLAKMPHALIAGTTGSGKSVCINTIIMSILFKQRPDLVKLILFDPKVVEMAMYKDIPHLMCPVINDAAKATSVLEWACEKMDERYEFLAEAGVRNIAGYNKLTQDELFERFQPSTPEEEAKIPKKLPYIVIIIDELADLMMTSGKEVETHIVRIAQKARAVGIHLILATQRPSANVVTGLIKSNMPTRIAFRVQSKMDSRIVLDQNGADLLLGHGDMLFLPPGASKPTRCQGTFIDDKEVRDSVRIVREGAEAQYEPELVQIKGAINTEDMEKDDLFDDAVKVVLETKRGSVSLLQRRLTIGYARASRLIESMAQSGILGDYKGSQAREVNITVEEWEQMRGAASADEAAGMTV